MNVQNRFIYKLKDRLGTLIVVPLGESDFTIDYNREDEEKLSYKILLSGKIKFVNEAFQRIMQMENSVYRCDEQVISIYKICNEVEKEVFVGKISLNEGEFDLDRCEVTLKFIEDNSDKCYNDNKGTKLNLFQVINERITSKTKTYRGVLERKFCDSYTANMFVWCGNGQPDDGNWTATSATSSSIDGNNFISSTIWTREIIEVDCLEVNEPDWILVEDNCSTTGKKKFARKVTTINCEMRDESPNGDSTYWVYECDIVGYNEGLTEIKNGLPFNKALIQLLNVVCPSIVLKSDFFQINPDNVSNINYVTGKISKVDNILIYQKSDVKRPNANNQATKLELNLEDVLEVLLKMFNVKWRIEGNYFILEHVSYFSKSVGIDVTSDALKKFFVGYRKYSYESSKIPSKETWKFKEQQGEDWNLEVVYSGCISNDSKNQITNILDQVTTDVTFVISNPSAESKVVDDEGFVLVSVQKINDEYFINSETSTNGNRLNNVFAWVQLFRDFHYYDRPMKTGKVNGVLTEFITTIPTKKGDRFSIPLDICNIFNPDNFIKTALGNGILSSGKYRFKDSMIELDLLYESNQDLVPNIPPVLEGGGIYTTDKNIPKEIDIVATDQDGFITSINVIVQPSNGTVEVLSFEKIKYTPNTSFVGTDLFSLQAIDNLSELSNIENFAITVRAENLPPVARDDEYFVWIGEPFFQGTSIFANDTDDYNSITLVESNVVTNQGVSVVISQTGFFDYIPPSGFIGNDFFNYSIKDDSNNISSAKVTLKVSQKNIPIAVKDNYQTLKNTILNADGSVEWKRKMTDNDYTPDGQVYVYSTTPETKTTSKGGNVVISNDGTFVYTPLNDYLGKDDFNYTVSNSNGSSTGNVEISVLPVIYVRMLTNDLTIIGGPGQPTFLQRQDYILYFFSDAAKTIPFDVTGLNFRVNIEEVREIDDNGNFTTHTSLYSTSILSGTSYKFLDNFTFSSESTSENNNYRMDVYINIADGSYIK